MSFASVVLQTPSTDDADRTLATGTDTEYVLEGSVQDSSASFLRLRLQQITEASDPFYDHHIHFIHSHQNNLKVKTVRSLLNNQLPQKLQYVSDFATLQQNPYTSQRSMIDVPCSNSLIPFVQSLGFVPNYEYVFKGHAYREGNIRCNVGKIYQLTHPGDASGNLRPISESHSVEISAVCASQDVENAKLVRAFADLLKPLVNADVVDMRKITK